MSAHSPRAGSVNGWGEIDEVVMIQVFKRTGAANGYQCFHDSGARTYLSIRENKITAIEEIHKLMTDLNAE